MMRQGAVASEKNHERWPLLCGLSHATELLVNVRVRDDRTESRNGGMKMLRILSSDGFQQIYAFGKRGQNRFGTLVFHRDKALISG